MPHVPTIRLARRLGRRSAAAVLAIAAGAALAGCGSPGAAGFTVVGTEMAFDAPATVEAGATEVIFRNDGAVPHELAFEDPAGRIVLRRSIGAGARVVMRVDLTPGTWELGCYEPGHYEAGMFRPLVVR